MPGVLRPARGGTHQRAYFYNYYRRSLIYLKPTAFSLSFCLLHSSFRFPLRVRQCLSSRKRRMVSWLRARKHDCQSADNEMPTRVYAVLCAYILYVRLPSWYIGRKRRRQCRMDFARRKDFLKIGRDSDFLWFWLIYTLFSQNSRFTNKIDCYHMPPFSEHDIISYIVYDHIMQSSKTLFKSNSDDIISI